ncbi:MAG: RNA methyltransferase [Candidatus Buchananbacteria bacterium]|nr:RNA methyltransferase [Candidatus Buchananbacteria bacterium]
MKISSPDNLKIKNLKKLKQKKYREKSGEFFVENLTIIKDALKSGYRPTAVFASEEFALKNKKELEMIIKSAKLPDWLEVSDKINKSFSNLENPSGICAVYKTLPASELSFDNSILYLNSIGDPGNLGTILRSALAFDFKNIILDETCADAYNFKTINAAKDAIFKINLYHDENLQLLKKIKSKMPIISTSLNKSKDINILKKYPKICLVLGDESNGVDKKIENLADESVKINISSEIESLNVASAAAIILHSFYNK